jgi:nucleotide-binding universal stress UspA family protein
VFLLTPVNTQFNQNKQFMIDKVLVTVAGRGLCEEMLNMLLDIPCFRPSSVTVLHVVPEQIIAEAMSEKLEEGGKILAEAVKSIKIDATKINPRLRQGDPKDVVCEIADEENSDLIIIGSRGLGRLQAILENSVSQYVFQLTSRPMLLVKDDIYVKKIKKIMVAVDKSEEAKNSLKLAINFAKDIPSSQLVLAHVKDSTGKSEELTDPDKDPVLVNAVAEVKRMGISCKSVTAVGKPGSELCKLADDNNVDLLVLGSPDRRPSIAKSLIDLDRLLGSSLSDYVRVYANCPVLLTRNISV